MIISVQFYKSIDFNIVKITLRKIIRNMFHENVFATLIIKKISVLCSDINYRSFRSL